MGVILSEERNSEFLTLPHWHSPSHLTCRLRGLLYYLQSKICPQTSWDFAVVQGIQILCCILKSKIWHTFARFRAPKYSIQTFFSHLVSTKLGTQKTLSMVPIFYTFFMGFYNIFFYYLLDQKPFWPFWGIFKKYLTTLNFKFYFCRLFFDVLGRIPQIF